MDEAEAEAVPVASQVDPVEKEEEEVMGIFERVFEVSVAISAFQVHYQSLTRCSCPQTSQKQ